MVDLSKYIQDMRHKGHSLENIKQHLLRYGYTQKDIDHAIYHGKGHGPNLLLPILIIIILVLIVGGILFYFNLPKEEIDINIATHDNEVEAGSQLRFAINLEGVNENKEYEVKLQYEVLTSGKRVAMENEELILIGEQRHNVLLNIPEVESGNYVLKVNLDYEDISEEDRVGFAITSKEIIREVQEDPEEQSKEETQEEPESEEEVQQEEFAPVVSIWQELENIEKLANENPNEAARRCDNVKETYKNKCLQNVAESSRNAQYCDIIEEDVGADKSYTKDRCYSSVAKDTNTRDLCDNVVKDSRRDNCYINFATQGDYTVCEKIINSYLQKSCKSLQAASS